MKKDAKSWDKVLATLIVAVMPYRNQEEE